MADTWYISSGGEVSGPYDDGQIGDLIHMGLLREDDLMSPDQENWQPVSECRAGTAAGEAPDDIPVALELVEDDPPPAAVAAAVPPVEAVPLEGEYAPSSDAGIGVFEDEAPFGMEMMEESPVAGAAPAAAAPPDDGVRVRDRVVVLGRRAAGKTVYLSTLYARLWRSLDGLTMRAVSGQAHSYAMEIVAGLARGEWPPATFENTRMDIRLRYRGKERRMICMDYSGENFRRAFVEDDRKPRAVRQLLDHLDRAGALMLLMDPAMVYSHKGDIQAAMDDDFGMVQAAARVRRSPGGQDVPMVIVLTKMDENLPLIQAEGGARDFVRNHWPALLAELGRLVIFQVSAVQTRQRSDGAHVPRGDSTPVNLENPLKFCLNEMARVEQEQEYERLRLARQEAERARQEMLRKEARRQQVFWAAVIVGILLAGAFVCGLIIVYR